MTRAELFDLIANELDGFELEDGSVLAVVHNDLDQITFEVYFGELTASHSFTAKGDES